MIDEDCGCGHKEKPTHMLRKKEEPMHNPNIGVSGQIDPEALRTALEKAIKQESMDKEKATTFIREVIRKVGNKFVLYPKSGGNRLGTHSSRDEAEDQEKAIHANK